MSASGRVQIQALTSQRQPWPEGLITIVEEGRGFQSLGTDGETATFAIGEWSEPTVLIETDETIELSLRKAPAAK